MISGSMEIYTDFSTAKRKISKLILQSGLKGTVLRLVTNNKPHIQLQLRGTKTCMHSFVQQIVKLSEIHDKFSYGLGNMKDDEEEGTTDCVQILKSAGNIQLLSNNALCYINYATLIILIIQSVFCLICAAQFHRDDSSGGDTREFRNLGDIHEVLPDDVSSSARSM